MKEKDLFIGGLYVVSDSYFSEFSTGKLMYNKDENRPNYFAMRDNDGIYWMIPLSSQTENYQRKSSDWKKKHHGKECVFYDFADIMGKTRVFLIGNAFPITPGYILRPYTIDGRPYKMQYTQAIERIRSKLYKYIDLVTRGALKPSEDIIGIKRRLLLSSQGVQTSHP